MDSCSDNEAATTQWRLTQNIVIIYTDILTSVALME